jgi:hypothetical protein
MTHGARQDSPGSLVPASSARPSASPGAFPPDADALAQAIARHLFTAGLDLDSALARIRDGPGTDQVCHAVAEIDAAIRDLRRLMLATVTAPPCHQTGPAGKG